MTIADKNGVDVIIPAVTGTNDLSVNIDYNFPDKYFYDLDHLSRDWDFKLMDGKRHIATVKFSAYQFMADGLDRRTIALKHLVVQPRARGQKKSYDIIQFVINTVTTECDRDWGPVYGKPVLFIEKQHLEVPEKERGGLFDILKRIAEKVIGGGSHNRPSDSGELAVSVIGEQISMQLIEGHLKRSNSQ